MTTRFHQKFSDERRFSKKFAQKTLGTSVALPVCNNQQLPLGGYFMSMQVMKIALCSLALVAGFSGKAFAEETQSAVEMEVLSEREAAEEARDLMSAEELDALDGEESALSDADVTARRGGIVIKPGRGRVIIRPGFPVRDHRKVCFAQNGKGIVFKAGGYENRRQLQWEAMRECRRFSKNPHSCRPLGCQRR